jgi:hypothetical protein
MEQAMIVDGDLLSCLHSAFTVSLQWLSMIIDGDPNRRRVPSSAGVL